MVNNVCETVFTQQFLDDCCTYRNMKLRHKVSYEVDIGGVKDTFLNFLYNTLYKYTVTFCLLLNVFSIQSSCGVY